MLGIATTSWAATSIEIAWENNKLPEFTDEAGFAIGVLGLIVVGVAGWYSFTAGTIVSLPFDGSSAALDVYSMIRDSTVENGIILAMDGAPSPAMRTHWPTRCDMRPEGDSGESE